MTTPTRGFNDAEFAARCTHAQAAMARADVGALLLTSEAEIRYFTGFMTQFWQSPTRPWFVVIPSSGKPVAVIPSIGAPLMRQCYTENIISWASPAADDDGITLVADVIRQHVAKGGSLGMLMGRETAVRMPLADLFALQKALSTINLHDMTADIQQIRMVKSPAEQAKLRHICGIVSDVFAHVPDWLQAGMPFDSCFRRFKIDALERGVDDVSYLVGGVGAGGYDDIIGPPVAKALATGDVLMFDTGCIWDGYFSDFDRNFSIGPASAKAQDAHKKLFDATEAALSILRPGITAADLFAAMDDILRPDPSSSGDDVGRYGHGLGIQLTETPSHTAWDKTEITAGMALTIEPSISYGNGFMMVAEENLLVHDDHVELLTTRAPRDLPVI
ncbi:MAG: M24 family metallopeptidase [Candidatus Puniceispirillaceae bacterium]